MFSVERFGEQAKMDSKGDKVLRSGQFRGQKSLGPLEISLEKAHYVVRPQKNNIPHFHNQRCINS